MTIEMSRARFHFLIEEAGRGKQEPKDILAIVIAYMQESSNSYEKLIGDNLYKSLETLAEDIEAEAREARRKLAKRLS